MKTFGPTEQTAAHDAISECAAEFWERRRFGGWSGADQAELDAWLAESTLHRVAYLRVEAIAARTDQIATVHTFKVHAAPDPSVPGGNGKFHHWRFMLPLLAAASVALFVTLGIPFVKSLMQPADRIFATNTGGRATLKFTDGTEIELNTDTAVRYRMTTRERRVWLEKGEAYFRVAHNAANPFSVEVEGHRVTDLGTEFLVRAIGDLDVVLVKGRAQVVSDKPGAPAAMLIPGDEAVSTPVGTFVTKRTPQELADELAWRRGVLVFRNTPLAEVVREFNRYNEVKLVITDPSIAHLKFSAELTTDDYADFLQLAQSVLKLHARRDGNRILLSRG